MKIIHTTDTVSLSRAIEDVDNPIALDKIFNDIKCAFTSNTLSEKEYLWTVEHFCSKCKKLRLDPTEHQSFAKALIVLDVLKAENKTGFLPRFTAVYQYIEKHFFALVMLIMLASLTIALIGRLFPGTPMQKIGTIGILITVAIILGGIIVSIAIFRKK